MALPEEQVLEPKDPRIKDSDNWPSYTLKRTKVLSQKTGNPSSLLEANINNPVQVFGILDDLDPSCRQHLKNDRYRSKTIELDSITTYAFAEYDDGTYGFWAAGRAGWFELKDPVPMFRTTFEGMNEAASMFYTLADKLRRAHKTNPKWSVKGLERYANNIFKEYLLHSSNPLRRVDVDDVREGFHQHREYIVTCMLEAQEGLDWEKSAIFNYFKHKFPETFTEVHSIMARDKGRSHPDATYQTRGQSSKPDHPNGDGRLRVRPATRKASILIQKDSTATGDPSESPDTSDSSTSEDKALETPSPKPSPGNGSHKRKSILQPKGSKYSKKGTHRRGNLPIAIKSDSDDDSDEEIEESTSPLATAVARNTTTLTTRTPVPPKKHSSAIDDYASHHTYLPRITEQKVLVSYALPSTEPQGPGDIWTCTFEGCLKRVHAASSEDGKAEIQEHFKDHTASAEEKIQLAITESRPYLPVGNLVAHLQAHQSNEPIEATHGGASPGRKFPRPIRRSPFFH